MNFDSVKMIGVVLRRSSTGSIIRLKVPANTNMAKLLEMYIGWEFAENDDK